MSARLLTLLACFGLALTLPAHAAWATQEPAPAPEPTEENAEETTDGMPSLDELLGLEDAAEPAADVDPDLLEQLDPDRIELERKLTKQEAADELASAVQQMHETAFRLEEIRDTGVVTQRIQEEIITKLDVLIKNAESQSSGGGGSSSSSSSSSSSQSQPNPGQQPSAGQTSPSNDSQGDGSQDGMRDVPFQEGQRNVLDASRAAWGSLPERVRERLTEGSSDYFSEWYRAWTEAYYKRIAEEVSE